MRQAAQRILDSASPLPESAPRSSPANGSDARRIATNRANAAKSTGPRTPEGKARSCQNALTHGLYANTWSDGPLARAVTGASPWLGEDPDAFARLHARLMAKYEPEDVEEEKMVERLALLWTRLDRLSLHAQRRLLQEVMPHDDPDWHPDDGVPKPEPRGDDPRDALMRCEALAAAEARLERSISRLQRDLAFLTRHRRPRVETSVQTITDVATESLRSLQEDEVREPRAVVPADPPPQSDAASATDDPFPRAGEGAQRADRGSDPGPAAADAWLPLSEVLRRKRLLWKLAPDVPSQSASQPGA